MFVFPGLHNLKKKDIFCHLNPCVESASFVTMHEEETVLGANQATDGKDDPCNSDIQNC